MSAKRNLSFLLIFLALTSMLLTATSAFAQGIIVEPPPPGRQPILGGPISIDLFSVDAVVDGPIATVRLTQIFRNETDWEQEGTYIFPLPTGAAVGDFQMTVDGQVLEGKVMPKDQARAIYEDIVRRRKDPALLEYLGLDLFQTSVFPIPAHATRKLDLTYTQPVPLASGLFHFRFPLQTRQYSSAPIKQLALRVELRNQPGLRTIYSSSHNVSIQRTDEDSALIGFEAANTLPERDFDLYFGTSKTAIGLNLISYHPSGEDGFFLLMAAPSLEAAAETIVRRDIILVLDVSGSMEGSKLDQAKQAAHFLIDHLNPGDRFNLIAFSTGSHLWEAGMQDAAADSIAAAHAWIDRLNANGSTDINRALLEALGQLTPLRPDDDSRPAYVLFVTDGLPTQGEVMPDRIIKNALDNLPPDRNMRLFAFGVGYDVDTDLLDNLSSELGGRSSYVKPDQRIDEVIGDFYQRISTPVLTNINIDWGGLIIDETYPFPLPDLFAGEQLLVAGRYRQGGDITIRLSGEVNGKEQTFEYPGQTLVARGGDSSVARLWATRKIGALLTQIRRQGSNQELIDAITHLSLIYGIVTPYTSYLVLEPHMVEQGRALPMPTPLPMDAPAVMPKALRATVEVEALAAAPASGEAAVASSEAREDLYRAERAADQQGVRFVAGKTFTLQNRITGEDGNVYELWVDNAFTESMSLQTVVFSSDAYFALAADPEIAPWLAVSPELVLVHEGKAYRITTKGAVPFPTPSVAPISTTAPTPSVGLTPTPAASAPAPSPNIWQQLLDWLRQLFTTS